MKLEYKVLHQDMLLAIDQCKQQTIPENVQVESCFWLAIHYWGKLKELITKNDFTSELEEIEFFRNVKPQFTSYIEYFVILSEALQFAPEENAAKIVYWQQEMGRYDRFLYRNRIFIHFYESNSSTSPIFSFRRMTKDQKPIKPLVFYDADTRFCSLHDHLIRGYLAEKKYHKYAKEKRDETVMS